MLAKFILKCWQNSSSKDILPNWLLSWGFSLKERQLLLNSENMGKSLKKGMEIPHERIRCIRKIKIKNPPYIPENFFRSIWWILINISILHFKYWIRSTAWYMHTKIYMQYTSFFGTFMTVWASSMICSSKTWRLPTLLYNHRHLFL